MLAHELTRVKGRALEAKVRAAHGVDVVSAEIAGSVVSWLMHGYTTEDILEAAHTLEGPAEKSQI